MEKKPYHHGNLQIELIEEGLALIHEEGLGRFSLRKLSKRVGVSPMACYNHYSTVEELLNEMKNYVTKRFCDVLLHAIENDDIRLSTINMGKAYVEFFAKNPHYLTFIYDNENYKITLTDNTFEGDYEPFCIFKENSLKCMQANHINEAMYHDNLVIMWTAVHGLAAMANMKGFQYEGEWDVLTEKLLTKYLNSSLY